MFVSRAQVTAVACAAWQAAFLAGDGIEAVVVPPITLTALLLIPHRAPLGGLVAIASAAIGLWLGASTEDPAGLVPYLAVAYGMGRNGSPRHAPWFIPLYGLAGTITADPFAITLVFSCVLTSIVWLFGFAVRRRATQTIQMSVEQQRLQDSDPAAVADRVVREERLRLRAEITTLVRQAVQQMHADAVAASERLDDVRLGAIQTRGARAIADLRRLLGLLRDEEPQDEDNRSQPRSTMLADGITAAGVAVLAVVVDPNLVDHPRTTSTLLLLSIAATVPLAWRRREPAWAAVVAAAVMVLAVAVRTPLHSGFGMLAELTLLAWSLGARRTLAALGAGTLLTGAVVLMWGAGDILFILVVLAISAFAGHEWGERDRALARARQNVEELQEEQNQAVSRAVAEDRLRIARELHDVTSHAVGVMVLQAGAAKALKDTDPAAARSAVQVARDAGAEALAELKTLLDVFEAGNPSASTAQSLPELMSRMRSAGLEVTLDAGAVPADREVAMTAYRTVQEALTNAIRHAPGVPVVVRTAAHGTRFSVEVRNQLGGGSPRRSTSGGFGLVGLAERVRSLGGEFDAGPEGEDFVVRASLDDRVRGSA